MNLLKKMFKAKVAETRVFDISLERMKNSFYTMEHEAHWDVKDALYWGYYFLDEDLNKLETFAKKLRKEGLETVELRKPDESMFLLHIEEHAIHTPDSLFNRCHKLAKLAIEEDIGVFDGWDVEQLKMNKGLVE